MSTDLQKRIAAIPGEDGWWSSGSEEDYMELAKELLSLGMTEERVVDFLDLAYWAAANCYGA